MLNDISIDDLTQVTGGIGPVGSHQAFLDSRKTPKGMTRAHFLRQMKYRSMI